MSCDQIETLLQLSNNSKQSRDSISVSLANLKEYPVGIDLQKALAHPGSADDLVLRDGDVLYIPQQQSTVKVSGSVTYPNSVTYTKGMDVVTVSHRLAATTTLPANIPSLST